MRKVRTASGATAVQIVSKSGGVRRIVEHLGSAHDETELEVLLEAGRQKIAAWQGQGLLDLESLEPAPGRTGLATTTVESKHSRLLWEVLHGATGVSAWVRRLGVIGPLSRWFWLVWSSRPPRPRSPGC